jgi:hypothetical protein
MSSSQKIKNVNTRLNQLTAVHETVVGCPVTKFNYQTAFKTLLLMKQKWQNKPILLNLMFKQRLTLKTDGIRIDKVMSKKQKCYIQTLTKHIIQFFRYCPRGTNK